MSIETISSKVEEHTYEDYKELGGIINEADYKSALSRVKTVKSINRATVMQVLVMAQAAGLDIEDPEKTGKTDPRIALYAVLREDTNPGREKYHHSQMSDQPLFAEVLRMLGREDSLNLFLKAHPNIFPENESRAKKAA